MSEYVTIGFRYAEAYELSEWEPVTEDECLDYFQREINWLLGDSRITIISTEIIDGGERNPYDGSLSFEGEAKVELTMEWKNEYFEWSAADLVSRCFNRYINRIDYVKQA